MAFIPDEYEKRRMYEQYSAMQNAFNTSTLQSIGAAMGNGNYVTKESRIKELQNQISRMTLELEKLQLDEPHQGPTNRELNKHEALKNAWDEYKSIRKLVGL